MGSAHIPKVLPSAHLSGRAPNAGELDFGRSNPKCNARFGSHRDVRSNRAIYLARIRLPRTELVQVARYSATIIPRLGVSHHASSVSGLFSAAQLAGSHQSAGRPFCSEIVSVPAGVFSHRAATDASSTRLGKATLP